MKLKQWLTISMLALLALNLQAQGINYERLSGDLQLALEKEPNEVHSVYISLADYLDVRALENELKRNGASVHERGVEVVTQLKAKAEATQPSMIEYLEKLDGVDSKSLHPFWIANVIFFEANATAIAELSRNDAIEYIDIDWPIEFYDLEQEDAVMSPPLLDNTEPGLVAIGATEMWEMGYTGYGQTVLIVDTGEDAYHPALFNNFAFHNRSIDESWAGGNGPHACENDHGTHVTGTAVGIDRKLRDTIGVAYEGEWMGGPIPLSDCDFDVSVLDAFATFQWALDPDDNSSTTDDMPDVINNSWGRPDPSTFDCNITSVVNMYNALLGAGIAVVYAAGNEGPGISTVGHPAINNYDLVRFFSVGNLDGNNMNYPIYSGSSRGPSICPTPNMSLEIKPEVSAPGVEVRSSVFNNGYSSFTGTSMSSPHVSGAIMILKEAFPELSGEDLMLALYLSAIDLGVEGEDNDYGMGIINLPAAYQYLIDEGHNPTPPVVSSNDVNLLRAEVLDFVCLEGVSPFIEVENIGTDVVESILVTCTFTGSQTVVETYEWDVTIAPGDREEVQIPLMEVPVGEYELLVELTEINGTQDDRDLNNRLKREVTVLNLSDLPAAVAVEAAPCENGQVVLESSYEGDATIKWYDEETGGTLLGEGSPVLLSVGSEPQTVFAQVSPIEKVGKEDDSEGSISFSDNPNGLIFNTNIPVTIKKVKMYADEEGGRIIRLNRADGGSVSKVVSLVAGENIVELDFSVPPGNQHEIYMQAGKPLAFSLGGTNYPYVISDVLTITGPNTGSGLFYHYFFDWEVEFDYVCGRTPVAVDVAAADNPFEVSIDPTETIVGIEGGEAEVQFTGVADGAVSWNWDFGNGNTSDVQNPTFTFTDTGSYEVLLTVVGPDGCSNSTSATVVVDVNSNTTNQLEVESRINLFPNPTTGEVILQFDWPGNQRLDYYLIDMFGRKVSNIYTTTSGQQTESLSLGALPSGTYLLVVETEEGRAAKRIVKQ
ncbi:MAG: S8 family serine peptidase [Chitinophagales bacterium]|nr:S8 family serine peptidase [Chitinophagales bacterium]